jgi:hypothetical protein
MADLKVISLEKTVEYFEHLMYNVVNLTIPNLELYEIVNESTMNFHSKLFYEITNLFWNPYIRIEKNASYYTYKIRVYDLYSLKNISMLENLVNNILEKFPFKTSSRKRKQISDIYEINKRVKILNISQI